MAYLASKYFQLEDSSTHSQFSSDKDNVRCLKAYISYELGGMNYFHGEVNPRGYYLHVAIVERGEHFETVTLLNNTSFKALLREVKRKSAKVGNELVDQFDELALKYAQILCERTGDTLVLEEAVA